MKRIARTPEEQDALTAWHRFLYWQPGQRQAVKRRANRRERRAERRRLKGSPDD